MAQREAMQYELHVLELETRPMLPRWPEPSYRVRRVTEMLAPVLDLDCSLNRNSVLSFQVECSHDHALLLSR